MKGGDQEAEGDPHRLGHVVVLDLPAVIEQRVVLREDRDQARRYFEVALVLVGAERCESVEPLLRRLAGVELAFLDFSGLADLLLDLGVGHDHEVPRLQVGAGGRGPGGAQAIFDDFTRDRTGRELADGATPPDLLVELAGAGLHFLGRVLHEGGQGHERLDRTHAHSFPMRLGGDDARPARPPMLVSRYAS